MSRPFLICFSCGFWRTSLWWKNLSLWECRWRQQANTCQLICVFFCSLYFLELTVYFSGIFQAVFCTDPNFRHVTHHHIFKYSFFWYTIGIPSSKNVHLIDHLIGISTRPFSSIPSFIELTRARFQSISTLSSRSIPQWNRSCPTSSCELVNFHTNLKAFMEFTPSTGQTIRRRPFRHNTISSSKYINCYERGQH